MHDLSAHDTVLILGLGDSGLAMARWCARAGAQVQVWDSRAAPPQADALARDVPAATRLSGELAPAIAEGLTLVLKSPGLAPDDARIAPLLQEARARGLPVLGELDLFAAALARLKRNTGYAPKLVAITGTNGKTTTTAMAALLIGRTGRHVGLAGNIGPTLLDTLAEALDAAGVDPNAVRPPAPQAEVAAPEAPEAAAAAAPVAATATVPVAPPQAHEATADVAAAAEAGDVVAHEHRADDLAVGPGQAVDAAPMPMDAPAGAADDAQVDAAADAAADAQAQAAVDPQAEAAVDAAAETDAIADLDAPAQAVPPLDDDAPAPALLQALVAPPPEPEPDPLAEALAKLPQAWVLELSSFQLEGGGTGVTGFEPDAAAVLNITQDHLDWHGGMAAYTAAKARVFGPRGTLVLNRDDALVAAMAPAAPAPARGAGRGKIKVVPRPWLGFGLEAPQRPGDFGLVVENGIAWLTRALPADETYKPRPGEEVELHLQRLMPADALRVRGRHNAANAMAALALAVAIGCPLAPMLHGLREYTGEPHRVQWVATINDVEAYDDSKGTNVGATVAALEGLGADKAPSKLIVILGGDGKGQDFSPLLAAVQRHVRAVATLGRDAAAIEAALAPVLAAGLPLQRHPTLEEATAWCFQQAQSGDAVLLSPACASLDMFRNYGHRAEVFVQAVQALALERGVA